MFLRVPSDECFLRLIRVLLLLRTWITCRIVVDVRCCSKDIVGTWSDVCLEWLQTQLAAVEVCMCM